MLKHLMGVTGTLGVCLLAGCGGGGNASQPPAPPPAFPPPSASLSQASVTSPFTGTCNGAPQSGTLYLQAEVEPYVAVNPANTLNVLGVWQQDRWSNGGAQGLMAAASYDGGLSWNLHPLPTAVCAGGTDSNGGDYERASDPWVSFSPTGIAYAISLSLNNSDGTSAMLVTRSGDGGTTWSDPVTLIRDNSQVLDDKESITADPADANYVYAVWDRLDGRGYGPTWFSRTSDGGLSWEPARLIYDPGQNAGAGNQTLGNQIAVLPDGTLVDLFTRIDALSAGRYRAELEVIRSGDHGASWSAPITIAAEQAIGASDPQTGQSVRDGAGLADIAVGPTGILYVAWQDSRFSGGARDGIALSTSEDGGLTWSAPVEIKAVTSTQAFTPSVEVLTDGTLVVTYYDFRNDTASASSLVTDLWESLSAAGRTWHERHVSGPFNLALAPKAEGLFLGDYQGLATNGVDPLPFFARTVSDATGPTDIFAFPPTMSTPVMMAVTRGYAARPAPEGRLTPAARSRISDNLRRLMQREARLPRPPFRPAQPD